MLPWQLPGMHLQKYQYQPWREGGGGGKKDWTGELPYWVCTPGYGCGEGVVPFSSLKPDDEISPAGKLNNVPYLIRAGLEVLSLKWAIKFHDSPGMVLSAKCEIELSEVLPTPPTPHPTHKNTWILKSEMGQDFMILRSSGMGWSAKCEI